MTHRVIVYCGDYEAARFQYAIQAHIAVTALSKADGNNQWRVVDPRLNSDEPTTWRYRNGEGKSVMDASDLARYERLIRAERRGPVITATEPDAELMRDPSTGLRELYDKQGRLRAVFHCATTEAAYVRGASEMQLMIFDRDAGHFLCGDVSLMGEEA